MNPDYIKTFYEGYTFSIKKNPQGYWGRVYLEEHHEWDTAGLTYEQVEKDIKDFIIRENSEQGIKDKQFIASLVNSNCLPTSLTDKERGELDWIARKYTTT